VGEKEGELGLRVELGTKGFEHFFPVLMGGQAATRRETDHMARVQLPAQPLATVESPFKNHCDLHIERRKSVTPR
jgi:hypothetical protein